MKEHIIDLLNRDFEIADIKAFLLEQGYSEADITQAIQSELEAREGQVAAIPAELGWRGLINCIGGAALLTSLMMGTNSAKYSGFLFFARLFFGLWFLGRGLYLITRPVSIYAGKTNR